MIKNQQLNDECNDDIYFIDVFDDGVQFLSFNPTRYFISFSDSKVKYSLRYNYEFNFKQVGDFLIIIGDQLNAVSIFHTTNNKDELHRLYVFFDMFNTRVMKDTDNLIKLFNEIKDSGQ